MKTSILTLAGVLSLGLWANAFAQSPTAPSEFKCFSSSRVAGFTALRDPSHFEIGSGYAELKNAELTDNYTSANLVCEIAGAGSWGCVGFAYNTPGHENIIEVTIQTNPVTHVMTLSHTGPHAGSWVCQ